VVITLSVAMRRGGRLPLRVTGTIRDDEPVMGSACYEVDVESVQWPHGGEVDERLIADMDELEDDFLSEAKKASRNYI
jgi:hypothetical protein